MQGAILLELYTRDGITGVCMIAADLYEGIRPAQLGDQADVRGTVGRGGAAAPCEGPPAAPSKCWGSHSALPGARAFAGLLGGGKAALGWAANSCTARRLPTELKAYAPSAARRWPRCCR